MLKSLSACALALAAIAGCIITLIWGLPQLYAFLLLHAGGWCADGAVILGCLLFAVLIFKGSGGGDGGHDGYWNDIH